jgi:ribonuclease PH
MRDIAFEINYLKNPHGSCLAIYGETKVICTATIEDRVPSFLEGKGSGWLSAEYGMLPGSTGGGRKRREIGKRDGRSTEIQRLIGRTLRSGIDLSALGERSITIDCDVIQADGGTRTASISGAWLAMVLALKNCAPSLEIDDPFSLITGQVGAISVGIVDGEVICDLDYYHDSRAEVDMNVVKLDSSYVEIQGTGEKGTFDSQQLSLLLQSADEGISVVFSRQLESIGLPLDFTFRG